MTQTDPIILAQVTAERLTALHDKIDHGFKSMSDRLTAIDKRFDSVDKELCETQTAQTADRLAVQKELEAIRTDVAVFKARWGLIAAIGTPVVGALASFLVHMVMHGGSGQ